MSERTWFLASSLIMLESSLFLILISTFVKPIMSCVMFSGILVMLNLGFILFMGSSRSFLSPFVSPVIYVAGEYSCVRGLSVSAFDSVRRLLECLCSSCRVAMASRVASCPDADKCLDGSSFVYIPSVSFYASDVAVWRAFARSELVFVNLRYDCERFEVHGRSSLLYARSNMLMLLLSFFRRLSFFDVWRSSSGVMSGSCGVFSDNVSYLSSYFLSIEEVLCE